VNDKHSIAAQLKDLDAETLPWYRRNLVMLIIAAVVFAIALTSLSLHLYSTSTASQLDLSRPGYESVRAAIEKNDIKDFSATGVITGETIDQFDTLYDAQVTKTQSTQLSSDALSDEALGLPSIGN